MVPSLDDRRIILPVPLSDEGLSNPAQRNPRLAAFLSVLPGLGQLYNGETGKGLLFLGVAAVNLALVLALLFNEPFFKFLAQVATACNMQFNWDFARTKEFIQSAIAVGVIYFGLLICFVTYAVKEAYRHAAASHYGMVFARFFLGLPEATSGSYLFHFLVMATCLVLAFFVAAPKPPATQTTVIELIPPPPPPPPPVMEKPKPAPTMLKKIVLVPPEPAPKVTPPKVEVPPVAAPVAVAIPTADPSPLAVAPAIAPGNDTTSSSSGGGTSDAASDGAAFGPASDVDYSGYLSEMQRRIKKAWFPPKGNESKRISLRFKISQGGNVSKIRLVNSSGISIADGAAIAAVENSAPYGPLPKGAPASITIMFTFDYNIFNGGGQAALHGS